MVPVNEFLDKSRQSKLDKFDILDGMLPCNVLYNKMIFVIDSELSSQVTPYQLHHDIVVLSQLPLYLQVSPAVESYKSFNDRYGDKEGAEDDNEGFVDGITDNEGT